MKCSKFKKRGKLPNIHSYICVDFNTYRAKIELDTGILCIQLEELQTIENQ